MRLLLVRHAESVLNEEGLIQGQSESPLSARGRAQAAGLTERLKTESLDYAFSSDLERARQTANVILGGHEVELSCRIELRERDFGEFVGRPYKEFEMVERSSDPLLYRPAGGESLLDLQQRVKSFLDFLGNHTGTLIVISHRQVNRMMLKEILGEPFESWPEIQQDRACLNILEGVSLNSLQPLLLNCTRHCGSSGGSSSGSGEV